MPLHRGTDEDQSIYKSRPAGPPSNVTFCFACMVLRQACSGGRAPVRLSPACGGAVGWGVVGVCGRRWRRSDGAAQLPAARVAGGGAWCSDSAGWRSRRVAAGLPAALATCWGGRRAAGGGGVPVFVAALGRVVPSASGGAGAGRAWWGPGGVVAWGSSLGRLRFLSPPGVFGWALLALGGVSARPVWHGCSKLSLTVHLI